MQRKTLFYSGLAIAAIAALLVWAFAPRPIAVEVAEAGIGRFETTIDEDARTRLRDRFIVSAPLAGNLQRMALREGDVVASADPLATLTPVLSPLLDERTVREQTARIAAAEASVMQANTRIGTARLVLEQAGMTQRRTEQLAQHGFVSPDQIDNDRLATRSARSELANAIEGERVARHNLTQARAALVAVRGGPGSGAFVLRAPIAGQVLKVYETSESVLALGAPIIAIGDTAQLEVVAELLSTDALRAQPGSAVRIERWGGPTALLGAVRRVEPAAFTKVSALGVEEQRVNVLIDITSPHAQWKALGDGYRVGVRILTRSEDAVLRVPVSAVFPLQVASQDATPGHAVFVLDAGRARLQTVTVGDRNSSDAWIVNGLKEGDRVIVYPPATVQDGTRVSPRKL